MSKETYENLFYTKLAPTSVYLQLADQSVCYVEGIALDLLVRIRDAYVPTDFVVLNMGISKDAPLILGRPFLNNANACIYVASGWIQFHLDGRKETFGFASRKPVFYEKQEQKKQPKKRRTRKPKPIEEKEEPGKNKPKLRGTWHKKKEASSTSSSPDPVNIPKESKEEEFLYKEEEPPRKEEQPWAGTRRYAFTAFSLHLV